MHDFVDLLGHRVMITIEDGDIEDTEGYNPGEVTVLLYPREHNLIFQLSVSDIPERFSRHPVSIKLILESGQELAVERFDSSGISKLRKLLSARQ